MVKTQRLNPAFLFRLGVLLLALALGFPELQELPAQEAPAALADTPPEAESAISQFYDWVEGLGLLGYLVFALAYVAATVFFLPGSVFTIGAGVLFGVFKGFLLVSFSSVAGASLAFLIARYVAREKIEKKFADNRKFAAVDAAIGREGGKIIFLMRLTPLFPFNLSNYLYGLTSVRFSHYALASWLGMIPGTFLYVYIGSLGRTAAEAAAEGVDAGKLVLRIIALAATIIVTVYVTAIARKALKKAALNERAMESS